MLCRDLWVPRLQRLEVHDMRFHGPATLHGNLASPTPTFRDGSRELHEP